MSGINGDTFSNKLFEPLVGYNALCSYQHSTFLLCAVSGPDQNYGFWTLIKRYSEPESTVPNQAVDWQSNSATRYSHKTLLADCPRFVKHGLCGSVLVLRIRIILIRGSGSRI